MNVATIILAAGSSSRMTQSKQLLQFKGKSFILRAAEMCSQLNAYKTFCITGHLDQELRHELKGSSISFLRNEQYQQGLSSSLQKAVAHISTTYGEIDAILVLLTDQPLIPLTHYAQLISEAESNQHSIIATAYNNTYGAPAIFRSKHFNAILQLKANQSPKSLITENLKNTLLVNCELAAQDIDTNQAYQKLIADNPDSAR